MVTVRVESDCMLGEAGVVIPSNWPVSMLSAASLPAMAPPRSGLNPCTAQRGWKHSVTVPHNKQTNSV